MVDIVDDAERLRRFSRFFTQRIGVLTDRYLGQPRPLGEARLLFEIGAGGADVRRPRVVLGLDDADLSRLLRSLERQGLARVASLPPGGGAHVATLTDAGRRELVELERQAGARGHRAVRRDTHDVLTEAIALYRASGYDEVASYDDNPHAHLWFHKRLSGPAPEPPL